MTRTMAILTDPSGVCRAWGLADDKETAEKVALEQLTRYLATTSNVYRDPIEYTLSFEEVNE